MFESGAILLYLADKTGRFIPRDLRSRLDCIQWVFWQMANLGPMAGQNHHFANYAPEKNAYAIDRYVRETGRLYAVLNKRLADREFVTGEYSIADMVSYPWVLPDRQGQKLDDFPHLKRWKEAIKARPATLRAYAKARKSIPAREAFKPRPSERSCSDRPRTWCADDAKSFQRRPVVPEHQSRHSREGGNPCCGLRVQHGSPLSRG